MKLKKMLKIGGVMVLFLGTYTSSTIKKNSYPPYKGEKANHSEVIKTNIYGAPMTLYNSDKPIVVAIDSSLDDDIKSEVKRAVERIDEVSEGLTFEYVEVDNFAVVRGNISVKEMDSLTKKITSRFNNMDEENVVGTAQSFFFPILSGIPRKNSISLNSEFENMDVYQVVLHEIMHTLGFVHLDQGHTIMRATTQNSASDLTSIDIFNINYYYPSREQNNNRTP